VLLNGLALSKAAMPWVSVIVCNMQTHHSVASSFTSEQNVVQFEVSMDYHGPTDTVQVVHGFSHLQRPAQQIKAEQSYSQELSLHGKYQL
jgi:hypothetical protein